MGFTLIEMSIVLVIIGLLVGGILVGEDLIFATQMRKVITESEKIKTGTAAFKLKYNCLPGDCNNATQYGFVGDGNGNDAIEYSSPSSGYNNTSYEGLYFFSELAQANLIGATVIPVTGFPSLYPSNLRNDVWWVGYNFRSTTVRYNRKSWMAGV
jgi:prepilin-type N-terminal cleavage/methylation domain-containing protein